MDKDLIFFGNEEFINDAQDVVGNNFIALSGTIFSDDVLCFRYKGVLYYKFILESRRLSNNSDFLPVTVSERLVDKSLLITGAYVRLTGHIHTSNRVESWKNRLNIFLAVKEISVLIANNDIDRNHVILTGFLCREPFFRQTPKGKKISDLLVAVNRPNNKSDYLPVIAWAKNAEIANTLTVGDKIIITGRMQSRVYQKAEEDGTVTDRTAYEISISDIKQTLISKRRS